VILFLSVFDQIDFVFLIADYKDSRFIIPIAGAHIRTFKFQLKSSPLPAIFITLSRFHSSIQLIIPLHDKTATALLFYLHFAPNQFLWTGQQHRQWLYQRCLQR